MTEPELLKYPIGKFELPQRITIESVNRWIDEIDHLAVKLRKLVEGLAPDQLELTYRPGGWAIRQIVHHLADSHMNSYIRFRLTLTEDCPTIKPYSEDKWAELPDAKHGNIEVSLILLETLHMRWVLLLRALGVKELSRTFIHPENGKTLRLDENIGLYAWHGNHHLAHIKSALQAGKKV